MVYRTLCFLIFFFIFFDLLGSGKNKWELDSLSAVKLQKEGIAAGNLGDFNLALEKFTQVYQIRERMFGKASIKLAPPLNNIGVTYKNFGNLDKAIEAYKKVEAICINAKEENNIVLGIAYTNLGNIYRLNGDYNQALQYQQNAYRVLIKDSLKYSCESRVKLLVL